MEETVLLLTFLNPLQESRNMLMEGKYRGSVEYVDGLFNVILIE